MMMQLQRYNMNVIYKKGKEMYLADTLSRAFLHDEQPEAKVLALSDTDISRISSTMDADKSCVGQ